MVTCMDVNNLKLDGMELVAGEEGLNRIVSWTYMVQTRPYDEHMNQGIFAVNPRSTTLEDIISLYKKAL